MNDDKRNIVLITGAARRIGAAIARLFHREGYLVVLHYNRSVVEADKLSEELNASQSESCLTVQADLNDQRGVEKITERVFSLKRLNVLVNNASSYYPTPLQQCNMKQWDDLINSNLKGPFFLSQKLAPLLTASQGAIVNISDTDVRQTLSNYPIYSIAKAGNIAMTKSLARELAPYVRVNSVAPGAILWPEQDCNAVDKETILSQVPMGRLGSEVDIAKTTYFLAVHAAYMTGQTIAVDGGKSARI